MANDVARLRRALQEAAGATNGVHRSPEKADPSPSVERVTLDFARSGMVRDLGHALKRARMVVGTLEEIMAHVRGGSLTTAEVDRLDLELRQVSTYAGYVGRSIGRARKDLADVATATVRV